MKLKHEQIHYIEFLSRDLQRIKKFYSDCFDWKFIDYGSDYISFYGDYVNGGFAFGKPSKGSILIVLYSGNLEETKAKLEKAGGKIIRDIFDFPGGRRFHFIDPDDTELAVWSDK
jgi:uncharacterized protein